MDKENTPSPTQSAIDVSPQRQNYLTTISEIYLNTSVEVIIISIDKVKLCLKDHLSRLGKKHSWMTPFAICVTIFLTIATAEFKTKTFGLSGPTWNAIFVIVGLLSLSWLVIAVVAAWRVETIDDVVGKLKNEAMRLPINIPSERSVPLVMTK